MPRVAVFYDWQNCYHLAREAFCNETNPTRFGNFHPKAMAELLADKGPAGPPRRTVSFVGVYVGVPDPRKDAKGAAAQSRRIAAWQAAPGPPLVVKSRGLRYPPGRDPEEKGVDVQLAIDAMVMAVRGEYDIAIIASADTDLLPVVEGLLALRAMSGTPTVEVIGWRGLSQGLVVPGATVRWIGDHDFNAVRDHTDYNIAS